MHISSEKGQIPEPGSTTQQTATLILDIDKDGLDDFVIGVREEGPALTWYKRTTDGWTRHLIDKSYLTIEAGGAFHDIDGDGDSDIVMGEDYQGNRVYWWENPYPNLDPDVPWKRYLIKDSGENQHHDQIFGDFDGDGDDELVFWNQGARKLFIADIPEDPKRTEPWKITPIWSGDVRAEGLAKGDLDGDGKTDLLAGGRWFKHTGGVHFTPYIIDANQSMSRIAVGDLKEGGGLEVVMVPGEKKGNLKWYEFEADPTGAWIPHRLLEDETDHNHSLQVVDINQDGNMDIFCGEMRLNGENPDATMRLLLGDGKGHFKKTIVAKGYGVHEAKISDLDGDGHFDILGKPYNWKTPRLDIWLSKGSSAGKLSLNDWERRVVDGSKPWKSLFISAADMDGDQRKDIVTGGWWYKNPGNLKKRWQRKTIGSPLNNMAVVQDFDGDEDMDVLGTPWKGSDGPSLWSRMAALIGMGDRVSVSDAAFVWTKNDGSGSFTVSNPIGQGDGDFLQGVSVGHFLDFESLQVALSWHAAGKGIQVITVPPIPSDTRKPLQKIALISQDECLSAGDIDRDGDFDLLLGTKWLQNKRNEWSAHDLTEAAGNPDRNRLADIDGDGRLDAVVGFEAINRMGKLAWYEQGPSPDKFWTEHLVAEIIGPMSLDVADMDFDGDIDIVAGEHQMENPSDAKLYIFENGDGKGGNWRSHVVYQGDEHHDGAQLADIDNDGDLDILSIGWSHRRVLLYENRAN